MKAQELFDRMMESYQEDYDIEMPYDIEDETYDAYAGFHVSSAKYVLVKKAQLWRADCFEHTFFRMVSDLKIADIERFCAQVHTYIEPQLVRQGRSWPPADHMYSYITEILICDGGIEDHVKKAVKKVSYLKNYLLTVRGYCEVRLLVFDLAGKTIFGNRAAKELVKGYTKAGLI